MRIQNPFSERWVPFLKTATGAGMTYFIGGMIQSAMAAEALCRNKWKDQCVELSKGADKLCAAKSREWGVCKVETDASQLLILIGVAAALFTANMCFSMCLVKHRNVQPLR